MLAPEITNTSRMVRKRKAQPDRIPFHSLPLQQRVAAIRYNLNWQGVALKLQYDRLRARTISPDSLPELTGYEFMSGRVDMDFLVIVVRRILRLANQAKGSGLDIDGHLKPMVRDFESRWEHVIDARDTLEHIDEPKADRSLVPVSSSNGEFIFLMPGKSIDLQQLFIEADSLCQAIGNVIKRYESKPIAPDSSP